MNLEELLPGDRVIGKRFPHLNAEGRIVEERTENNRIAQALVLWNTGEQTWVRKADLWKDRRAIAEDDNSESERSSTRSSTSTRSTHTRSSGRSSGGSSSSADAEDILQNHGLGNIQQGGRGAGRGAGRGRGRGRGRGNDAGRGLGLGRGDQGQGAAAQVAVAGAQMPAIPAEPEDPLRVRLTPKNQIPRVYQVWEEIPDITVNQAVNGY